MPTTTTDARTSFVVHARDMRTSAAEPAGPPSRRYPGRTGEFSSRAGLHPKPWLARLRRALREDLFALHYQPIVSLQDGAISHYEALIRLADSADGSLVPPSAFLPAAERYGLIQEIDRMVIAKVCALMGGELAAERAERSGYGGYGEGGGHGGHGEGGERAECGRHGEGGGHGGHGERGDGGSVGQAGRAGQSPRVAVNLSALSITDHGMLAHIERELVRNGVDPDRLVVEVTETAAIGDMERARAFCEGVHTLGSSVALDDFGAGFGSFQYLKRLPFRYLKIDGDFIRTLPASRKDQLVVQALVGVAQGMGKQTIAEYVGDEPTIGLLRNYGVDYAQGFGLGRPRCPVEAFAA